MADPDDGLEILSVGALYTGRWDKKYWSSSRGKDRYPYPVGYQVLRTHKGLTYRMEVHEGAKGPIFQIVSNDKQSASGETPERAWENFQKKCCSRLKFWHGKRFSGKIDGVEFFGFKNALVQRLLRELVATVNDASEQSSLVTNCSKASPEGNDMACSLTYECPDLVQHLEKSRVTRKRSRSCRSVHTKPACNDSPGRLQPQRQGDNVQILYSTPKKSDDEEKMIKDGSNNDHHVGDAGGGLPVLSNTQLETNNSPSVPFDSHEVSDYRKGEHCLAQVQKEFPLTKTCLSAPLVHFSSTQEEKHIDRQFIEVQALGFPVATESGEKDEVVGDLPDSQARVSKDSQVNHYGDLFAPDTLDTQLEITSPADTGKFNQGGGNSLERDEPLAAETMSEEPTTGSHSEDGSCYANGNSQRNDCDSVGEDITKSMMALLLPLAVPLLTYSSRKKRRKTKPSKNCPSLKLETESKDFIPAADVMSPAGARVSSGVEGQMKTSVDMDTTIPVLDNIRYVPDSFDNDQFEDHVASQVLASNGNVEAVAVDDLPNEKHGPNGKGLQVVFNASEVNDDITPLRSIHVLEKQQSIPDNAPSDPSLPLMGKCTVPLSESFVFKNNDNRHVPEMHHTAENLIAPDSFQDTACGDCDSRKASLGVNGGVDEQILPSKIENVHKALAQSGSLSVSRDLELSSTFDKNATECIDGSDFHQGNHMDMVGHQNGESVSCFLDPARGSPQNSVSQANEVNNCASPPEKQEHNEDIKGSMKLIGCFSHPMRISSVLLARRADDIYICVSCGRIEERKRDLILYKLETKEPSLGIPCVVGHTSMDLPVMKDEFGREVAIDKSGLQFIPGASGLVLADSIRMPYCREKDHHCLCSTCESHCFEENAVKIVQIRLGYVSLVLKLRTIHSVQCLLACEPEHLVALDESGRIYVWVMDPTWSSQTEEYVIPSFDLLPSRIVELKRIPKSASMVVGHNGYGEFSLWDIVKRSVISRFSAPASSVFEFRPISLFSWQKKDLSHSKLVKEKCVKNLLEATMLRLSGNGEANSSCTMEQKDVAVWIFICTSTDSHVPSGCYSSSYGLNTDGCWRLGLLINNKVVLGAALHPSAAAVGTSAGHAIIGTHNEHVHIWELATGTKLGTLHDFAGGVSHISTDDSTSSTVAIARNDGQLWVYLHT